MNPESRETVRRGGWVFEYDEDPQGAMLASRMVWVWERYEPPALTEKLNGLPFVGGTWRKAGVDHSSPEDGES